MTSLVELYLGNNNISNIREIFYIKNLSQLVILDLYGNPVAGATDNYRLFIIYHLKACKALDGVTIVSLSTFLLEKAPGAFDALNFICLVWILGVVRMQSGQRYVWRETDSGLCG